MPGRTEHKFYKPLLFVKKKDPNGRNVAYCTVCKKDVSNTAVRRLESHRRICKPSAELYNNDQKLDLEVGDINQLTCDQDNNNSNKRKANSSIYIDSSSTTELSFNLDEESSNVTQQSFMVNKITPTVNLPLKNTEESHAFETPKRLQIQKNKIIALMDEIQEPERLKIHEALLELFIVCEIEFDLIKSKYFKNFLQLLRPAYSLPSTDELMNLLSNVYEKHMKNIVSIKSSGILLICVEISKNSETALKQQVVSKIFDDEGKYLFIKKYEISSCTQMKNFIEKSILESKKKYGVDVHSIVSDFIESDAPSLENSDSNYLHFKCMSIRLELFIKDAIDFMFVEEVKDLLSLFLSADLEKALIKEGGEKIHVMSSQNNSELLKLLKSCLINYKPMQIVASRDDIIFQHSSISPLFEENFESKLNRYISILEFVDDKFTNKQRLTYTRSDEYEDWSEYFEKTIDQDLKKCIKKQLRNLEDPITLAANLFHPKYRGLRIRDDVQKMETIMMKIVELMCESGVGSYIDFLDGTGYFKELLEKNYESPKIFWRLNKFRHPQLAEFAEKILNIPAFAQNNKITMTKKETLNDVTFEREKILELYYLLKLNG